MSSRRRDWYVSFAPSGRIGLTILLPRVSSAMGGLHPWLQSFAPSGRIGVTILLPRVSSAIGGLHPWNQRTQHIPPQRGGGNARGTRAGEIGTSPSPLQGESNRRSNSHGFRLPSQPTPVATVLRPFRANRADRPFAARERNESWVLPPPPGTTPTGSRTVATGRVRRGRTPPVGTMVTAHPAPTGRRKRTMSSRRRDWYVSFAPSGRIGLTILLPRGASAIGGLHPWLQSFAPSGRIGVTISSHGLRPPWADYTRGYSPSPFQGEQRSINGTVPFLLQWHPTPALLKRTPEAQRPALLLHMKRRGFAAVPPRSLASSQPSVRLRRSTKSIERGKPRRFISLRRRAWTPPPPPCSPCPQW